ncbi:MAG: hypothetical protein M9944_12665 [Rhizobiaceae bacterium]|nr:hypothetical protein [Rhizobiaceae bacterium]
MSKPLRITQNQVTALCKGAAAAGHIAEVKIDGVVIRLIPAPIAQQDEKVDGKRKGHL